MSLDDATQLRDTIDNHGSVLQELGCNEELLAMLKSVHTNSVFKYSDFHLDKGRFEVGSGLKAM